MDCRVIIDPGHGGRDSGAVGASGLKEADVVLRLGRLLASLLPRAQMTRDDDVYVSLRERASFWPEADCFMALHCNAAETPKASGF